MSRINGQLAPLGSRGRLFLFLMLCPPLTLLGQSGAANLLNNRVNAAAAARDSGDPVAVATANQKLIATALDQLATLRLAESAGVGTTQATELYSASLQLEESPETRIHLATAEIQAGNYTAAIETAKRLQAAGPNNLKADRILASAYVQSGAFSQAVAPFTAIAQADPTVENLYPLATCLLETHDPADKQHAQKVFEQMQHLAGDSGSLHVLIGRAYRDADDMPAAIREFHRALALDPRTPHAHYFLGLAQLFLKDWKPTPEAEEELRKEIELYPQDYLANYMLGFVTSGERRYDESNRYLEAASSINPEVPEPFLYMGLNAYSQEDYPRAEKMLRKAVELTGADEARSNYQIRRAYVDLGRILSQSGQTQEAEVFLKKARDLQNRTMELSQQKVSSIMLAGGAGAAAAVVPLTRQQETQAVSSTPDLFAKRDPVGSKLTPQQQSAADQEENTLRGVLGLAYNDLGTAQAMQHQYPDALASYQQAEHWSPDLPGLYKNLGQSAYRASDYLEATRALSIAVKQQPEAASLRALLGMSYFSLNKYAEAAKSFVPLGQQGMVDSTVGYAWAVSLAHTGDMAEATKVLTTFEAEPRSEDVQLLIGQLWTEIGDYARANTTLASALAHNPSLPKAHFYAGLADIRWQHWQEATQQFQAELVLSPNDPDALYHLGFVDLQKAKTDEALALFRQVVAAHPNYANAQYQIGKILLDRGETADSIPPLEAAARLEPQTGYLHYQLQAAYRKENRIAEADHELDIYKKIKAASRDAAAQSMPTSNQ